MTERDTLALLASFLAGRETGDDRLRRHLDECEDCRGWAAEAAHPSSDELARWACDPTRIAATERQSVAEHLTACPECRREVELTRAALSAARAEPSAALPFDRPTSRTRRLASAWAIAAGLILAAALAFTFARTPAPEVRDQVLEAQTLAGTRVVEAAGSITATAVTIDGGSAVVFRAGESIALGNGFSVAENATLQVQSGFVPGEEPLPNGSS